MSCFKPTGASSKTASTINSKQQEGLDTVTDWITKYIDQTQAGSKYPGQLTADTPELFNQAYSQFAGGQYSDTIDQATSDLISGKPAYEFDPAATTSRWQSNFANPVMEAWRENVLPFIKESANQPGTLYSRGTSDYLSRKGSDFFGQNVAPILFSALESGEARGFESAENAASRRMDATSLPYQQFQQQAGIATAKQAQEQFPLDRAYQEYLRRDPFNYAQLLAGTSTASTQQTLIKPGYGSTFGEISSSIKDLGAGFESFSSGASNIAAIGAASDIRIKENIRLTKPALDRIAKLKSYEYNFIGKDEIESSLMAQDVEAVMPEGVIEVNGVKYIKFNSMIGLLVDGMNELRKEIN